MAHRHRPPRPCESFHSQFEPAASCLHLLEDPEPPERFLVHREPEPRRAVIQMDRSILRNRLAIEDVPEEFVADTIIPHKATLFFHRILLVGPDIDIWNTNDVIFALATRCRPGKAQETLYEGEIPAFELVPFMCHGYGDEHHGGKMIHDCLMPAEYTEEGPNWQLADYKHSYPKDLQDRIDARWAGWGF